MPIKSYIAFPNNEKKDLLLSQLAEISGCQAIAADNSDLTIVLTETTNIDEDKKLEKKLNALSALQHMTLVYGHME